MVTILKLINDSDDKKGLEIFREFKRINGFDLRDKSLSKDSQCGKYEYLYLFIDEKELDSAINIILENSISICSKQDFTKDLIDIVNNNKLDEFKSQFDSFFDFDCIVNEFIDEHIESDMILEKITKLGIKSLTETDYKILNR